MHLFTPNHVKLFTSCYPPTSALLTAGPNYSPNSHELSRLTYFASNHPGKLTKIGSELEKRLKVECRKAKSGNIRSRASLLISLSILRALATECRRDIALLSPSLISSVECTLSSVPLDLEVVARAASVFTAWTTYTNGHLVGADSYMTKDYLSILDRFASLSCCHSSDQEVQNRTRLIGIAALTAALNSEALYNDINHFLPQVSTILRPIMAVLFETPISVLDDQASDVKDAPSSPYLAEFRTRPALERRAASIHVHVDGDKGPSTSDVSDASLHALFSLLSHTNGAQLGHVMQSAFNSLDALEGWKKSEHCCWFAKKIAEWAQYQYRYVVPTWLVERLLSNSNRDNDQFTALQKTLTAMITSVFSSPTPFINLSSSDIMSSLLTLLLRRLSTNPKDEALSALVGCISSLGCHVYYSDQIQDLAAELINRLLVIEVQGILVPDSSIFYHSRSSAIRYLLQGLLGLVRAANSNESLNNAEEARKANSPETSGRMPRMLSDTSRRLTDDRVSRRTKIPPIIWQDTLSLLCDSDASVRRTCAEALVYYISQEMPISNEPTDVEGTKQGRKIMDTPFRQARNTFPNVGDACSKFLNTIHAYVYILTTSPVLGGPSSMVNTNENGGGYSNGDTSITVVSPAVSDDQHDVSDDNEVASAQPANNRRSYPPPQHGPRARKESLVLHLLERVPENSLNSAKASEEDYANVLKILSTIHSHLPLHGLLTGVPMMIALDNATRTNAMDSNLFQRIVTLKTIIAHVWLIIGQVWRSQPLVLISEQAISALNTLSGQENNLSASVELGVNMNDALSLITSCRTVLDASGLDQESLLLRLAMKWTPDLALKDFERSSSYETSYRGDGVSPLLKISPALMHIENISLQSLARSSRGLGVTDLREALEGRSSMSNPALARPPSVSTLDHAPSSYATSGDPNILRLTETRSRTRSKKKSTTGASGEVRDVLTRLGISKQTGSLLKATLSPKPKAT